MRLDEDQRRTGVQTQTASAPQNAARATPLLDAKAAGALLNVPASWVLSEARAERLPHVRLGRYVRFESAELEAWWRSRARGPRQRIGRAPVADGGDAA